MKLKKHQIFVLIAVSALMFGLKCTQKDDGKTVEFNLPADSPFVDQNLNPKDAPSKPLPKFKKGLVINDELPEHSEEKRKTIKESATKLTSRFNEFKEANFKKDDFVDFLVREGLEPEINIDEVEGLENLSIIRTSNTLKGIRYIHAQYMGDSEEDEILQHLSFELRPSKTAFKDAQKIVAESFPELNAPIENTADNMVIYKHDGYVVWIKQLDPDDVESDPFNPRTVAEDTGAVKIAMEFDIHPFDHDSSEDDGHNH